MRDLPEDCEQLVDAAARLDCESQVELSEWDAGVDETAHKVVVIHAGLLLGLLAAVLLDFEDVRSVRWQALSNSLLRVSRHAEVLELVLGEMLSLELCLRRDGAHDGHDVEGLRASSRDGIMWDVVLLLDVDTNEERVLEMVDASRLERCRKLLRWQRYSVLACMSS